MPYPANFLADRLRAAISGSVPYPEDVSLSPYELLRNVVTRLMAEGMTEDLAITTFASWGEGYGTDGALGGLNVYSLGNNKHDLEWTLPGDGIFCSLGTLLAATEGNFLSVPEWYRFDWMFIKDGVGGWIRVQDLADRILRERSPVNSPSQDQQ